MVDIWLGIVFEAGHLWGLRIRVHTTFHELPPTIALVTPLIAGHMSRSLEHTSPSSGRRLSNELCDLADGNRLSLVSKSEATQLWIVLKTFYTNATSSGCDFNSCDYAFSFLGVRWRHLRFAAGSLLQLVQKCGKGHFLYS